MKTDNRNNMNITVNGEKKEVPGDLTVLGLLEFLNIQHQRVAVELNQDIVKKDRYGIIVLKEGDSLEVVSFMGGGAPKAQVQSSTFEVYPVRDSS
jgi:thiamine biosynthesis protein ThiS